MGMTNLKINCSFLHRP